MMGDLFDPPANERNLLADGLLEKMSVSLDAENNVDYRLVLDGSDIRMNSLLGQHIEFSFQHEIRCSHCGELTPKSYQGLCYQHFTSLAMADSCMMSPEKCHLAQGTCREPEWGERVCQRSHYVYLANASGVKVGITRVGQVPVRWLDQGAEQAMIIARVSSRYLSGLLEVIFKQHVADKTNWRTMLSGPAQSINLAESRDQLFSQSQSELDNLIEQYGEQHVQLIRQAEQQTFNFPVNKYPEKVKTLSLDKQEIISGELMGIKGQYLLLDQGAFNVRRFTGYRVKLTTAGQEY